MKFEENLVRLRKEKGLSQEELAEKLDVSRQTVYKWESGQSYPELDRLVLISKLFGHTIDDLLHKDLQTSPVGNKLAYERFYNKFSFFMALGVFFTVLAPAVWLAGSAVFLGGAVAAVAFFVTVFIGVAILTGTGIGYEYFSRTTEKVGEIYTQTEKQAFSKRFTFGIVGGFGCILLGLIAALLLPLYIRDSYAYAVMLFFVGCGAFLFVYYGCLHAKYKMNYCRSKPKDEFTNKASAVIMISMTIIYFVLGFVFEKWHPGWVVFPIGGMICAIVEVIRNKEK